MHTKLLTLFRRLLFVAFCLSFSASSFSQIKRFCPHEHILSSDTVSKPSVQRAFLEEDTDEVYKIPVVVHVIHNSFNGVIGGESDNISEEQINSQIEVLNEDFRFNNDTSCVPAYFYGAGEDTKIEFCLASIDPNGQPTDGIVRKYTSKINYHYVTDDAELKAESYWPSDEYLNIWVTSLKPISGETILGYAQFPDPTGTSVLGLPTYLGEATDGVVIDYRFFGRKTGVTNTNDHPYVYGRTTTHEIGHYLGLLHTFEGCDNSGSFSDYCKDTPGANSANANVSSCDEIITQCRDIVMYQNYMDYTPDEFMMLFTTDQKTRMRDVLRNSTSRKGLLSSRGCCFDKVSTMPLTYSDDFESVELSTVNWEIDDITNGWSIQESTNNTLQVTDSNSKTKDTATVTSPLFLFFEEFELENPSLEYDVSYTSDSDVNSDVLTVEYDLGCNDKWKPIVVENDFANQNLTIPFTPLTENFTQHKVFINEFISDYYTTIRFRFSHIKEGEQQLHIDNVLVKPNSTTKQMVVFPNPTTGSAQVQLVVDDYEEVVFTVFATTGVKVIESKYYLHSDLYDFDLSTLPKGLYIIEANISGEVIQQKISLL